MKICTIDWCKNKYQAKWFCGKHYQRLRTHWYPNIIKSYYWQNRVKNSLYDLYKAIKQRCYNSNTKNYKNYWWRWITICDKWLWVYWFTNFLLDMWERPEWMTLDRIDNNWNYCPENCKRSNRHEQCANMRKNNKFVWVCYNKKTNKYRAYICINWLNRHIWVFEREDQAVIARRNSEIENNIYNN